MRIAVLFVVLSVVPLALAAEPENVSLKKLNDDPSVFQGKHVRVQAQVSGTITEKPAFAWLTVKGKKLVIDGSKVNKEGINFVIRTKDKDRLLKELVDGKYTRARITASVRKSKVAWLAVVSAIHVESAPNDRGNSVDAETSINERKNDEVKKTNPRSGNVEDWRIEELLESYDPAQADNRIARELEKRSKGKRFLVFKKNCSVDIPSSVILYEELRKGFSEREWFEAGGTLCKIYKVGVGPQELFDENPLYPGEPLRLDRTCEHTQRKWDEVPLAVRQVLYLALTDSKELTIEKAADAHYVLDQVKGKNAAESEKWVKERYPHAFSAYAEKKERNLLPTLKINSDKLKAGKTEPKKEAKDETRKDGKP